MTAAKVCDATLDPKAQAALRRLSGVAQFDDAAGTNKAGEPEKFSVRYAVGHLHDTYSRQGVCWVYKSQNTSGDPLLEIRFSAADRYPEGTGKNLYGLGVYAKAGPYGALLFFRCATKAEPRQSEVGDAKYVRAEMYSAANQMRGEHRDDDRMAILGSMSRAVAREAGCASGAGLDEGRTGS
ncbi:hypothetical protein IF655_29985 [Streptomyces sp. DSM 110735]|uniref:hypothetical protein n=1 Tax=Streptomyces sp. DSM 110735 TaxID=2775031 RepID=UPI0018F2AB90|nr:hypothetical protein [Streptomyces sp. DSM 110735]MBJ7907523.1 hypothetical protein [Streptomyces sp. DSM 110735]